MATDKHFVTVNFLRFLPPVSVLGVCVCDVCTGFVERRVRDGVIPQVPFLGKTCIVEDPFSVERFLSQCQCYTAAPNRDDRDRFVGDCQVQDGFGCLFSFTVCPRTHSDSTSDGSRAPPASCSTCLPLCLYRQHSRQQITVVGKTFFGRE